MEDNSIEISEQVPASRKLGEERARELIGGADEIRIAKGKKLDVFSSSDDADVIAPKMLGSTGNLRAPTVVVGSTVLVGFNEATYGEIFDVG